MFRASIRIAGLRLLQQVGQYISINGAGIFSIEPTFASTVVFGLELVSNEMLLDEIVKVLFSSVPSNTLVKFSALREVDERTGVKARDVNTRVAKFKL